VRECEIAILVAGSAATAIAPGRAVFTASVAFAWIGDTYHVGRAAWILVEPLTFETEVFAVNDEVVRSVCIIVVSCSYDLGIKSLK
jgi:hypothetical protein